MIVVFDGDALAVARHQVTGITNKVSAQDGVLCFPKTNPIPAQTERKIRATADVTAGNRGPFRFVDEDSGTLRTFDFDIIDFDVFAFDPHASIQLVKSADRCRLP